MKHILLILFFAAGTVAASAQSSAQRAATSSNSTEAGVNLPPGVPPVKGEEKIIFTVSLRYQDIRVGTGEVMEMDALNKFYGVYYTAWRAADGVKFDSTEDRPRPPLRDKDGNKVLDADGKPLFAGPQPMPFTVGMGGTGLGFNQGFAGMRVGGKRRIFVPWQLAYGLRIIPPVGPGHPGVPAKSDLIYDVELVDLTQMQASPANSIVKPDK